MKRTRIVRDDSPESPREWDNVGRMLCWHRRYNLGDKHNYDAADWREELACEHDSDLADKLDYARNDLWNVLYECRRFDGGISEQGCSEYAHRVVDTLCERMIERAFDNGYIAMPLYLYDHSGISMSTGRFSCPWDSGCVGVIVCDRETIRKEFDGNEEAAYLALDSEVKVYDEYLGGEVYGFIAEECVDGEWEHIDSCFGFFGHDYRKNGMLDAIPDGYAECVIWE